MKKTKQKPAKQVAKKTARAAAKPAPAPKSVSPKSPEKLTGHGLDSLLVKQLASILDETALTEIEYETGGVRIRVARNHAGAFAAPVSMAAPAPTLTPAAAAAPAAPAAAPVDAASHPGTVKSPMVGIAYTLPEPGAAPFAKIGDTVTAGQTIALIEAMKTFNPVKAPRAGKVTKVLIENGSPVEYGEPLMIIE